jgi:DNA-binding winged helix-turn-helix (wHTH) protein
MTKQTKHFYEFGPFRVEPDERLLWRNGEIVRLKPKAFDLLLTLVADDGHLLTKEELLQRVWPDSIVEEANLSHNIYVLREVLGDGQNDLKYIETVPRRGYRFVAKVSQAGCPNFRLIRFGTICVMIRVLPRSCGGRANISA